jgi:hypothetical protein
VDCISLGAGAGGALEPGEQQLDSVLPLTEQPVILPIGAPDRRAEV